MPAHTCTSISRTSNSANVSPGERLHMRCTRSVSTNASSEPETISVRGHGGDTAPDTSPAQRHSRGKITATCINGLGAGCETLFPAPRESKVLYHKLWIRAPLPGGFRIYEIFVALSRPSVLLVGLYLLHSHWQFCAAL